MKFKKLRFSENDKIEIEKFSKELDIEIDSGEMSDILASDGCGGICRFTCSYYCEPSCGRVCESSSCKQLCSEYAIYQRECPGCGFLHISH